MLPGTTRYKKLGQKRAEVRKTHIMGMREFQLDTKDDTRGRYIITQVGPSYRVFREVDARPVLCLKLGVETGNTRQLGKKLMETA